MGFAAPFRRKRASLFAVVAWKQVQEALAGGGPVIPNDQLRAAARAGLGKDIAAVLTTSGSTGTGRHVILSAAALLSAADSFQQRYGPATWSCALPTDYIAGFMTLVRAQVAGTRPRLVRADLADLDPATGTNAISLVPTQLYRALANPELTSRLRRYEIILIGGSRIPASLLEQAREADVNLITSYGMSETCGGVVFDGVALPGVQIGLESETDGAETTLGLEQPDAEREGNPGLRGLPGRPNAAGRILISGPQLFNGYFDDPQATAKALVGGRLRTQDRGLIESGRLKVIGRIDSVVISGGVNVDLDQINQILEDEPLEAVAFGVADPEWGTRIVLVAEPGRTLAEWKERLSKHLGAPALPKELLEVAKLPRGDRGKIDRNALMKLVEGN